MLIRRRLAKRLAVIAGGAMVLAACSTGSNSAGETRAAGETKDQTITVAWEQEFMAYNNNTADQNATANTVVLNKVLSQFWDYDEEGGVRPTEEFGTFEKVKDDPLTVKYTINDKAVWSDGEPIDCDDMVLNWVSQSNKYMSETAKDEEGKPLPMFPAAGTAGYDVMNMPECADGDKEITVTYAKPFADWQAMFGQFILPAHVVEKGAGVEDVIKAVKDEDKASLQKLGDYWNTAWVLTAGDVKKDITLSSGPYMLDSWTAGQSLTLKVNPKWWGTPPKASTIVFRFISAEQQAQALQNGEVQVIEPQPQVDVVKQIEAIGDSVVMDKGDKYTFEHLDFNFKTDFADPELRKAFALCVPRQTIVDNLIKPVNSNAEVMDARYPFPFQPDYQSIVDATNAKDYAKVDIAAAKAIVDAKGKAGMTVRIGYKTPNPRRTSTVQLIADSCKQAGFNVQDIGSDDFFGNGLANGNFDVALFAWSGSPLVTGSSTTYITDGGNNNGKYSNPKVDELTKKLDETTNVDEQTPIIKDIEKQLWADLATIPLFAHPGIDAYTSTMKGVVFQPSQSEVTWNMDQWDNTAS